MVGPLSALEMTGISRDGRVTCRVSPTEAQPQPGPAGPLGVFRGTLDRVLRQGSSMAHCPWADAWHPGGGGLRPRRVIPNVSFSSPRHRGSGPRPPPTTAPTAAQPPSCWPVLFLSPGACTPCNTTVPRGRVLCLGPPLQGILLLPPGAPHQGLTPTASGMCASVTGYGARVARSPHHLQHAYEVAREAPRRENTPAAPHPGTWANLGGPRDTHKLAGVEDSVTVRTARRE